ncbi:MAG: hypothetical protein ACJAQ4_001465 [Cryomorphaceae bacterium]|jgi:hypothetical protein
MVILFKRFLIIEWTLGVVLSKFDEEIHQLMECFDQGAYKTIDYYNLLRGSYFVRAKCYRDKSLSRGAY